jgi:hypothetical protein
LPRGEAAKEYHSSVRDQAPGRLFEAGWLRSSTFSRAFWNCGE